MLNLQDANVKSTLDTIFGAVLVLNKKDDPVYAEALQVKALTVKQLVHDFKAVFLDNVFRQEYAVFYELITKSKAYYFTEGNFRLALEQNQDLILDSPYINLEGYTANGGTATKDELFDVFYKSVVKLFKQLAKKIVTEAEFETACNIYKGLFREDFVSETIQNMALIMSDTGWDCKMPHKRTVRLHGSADANRYYMDRMLVVDSFEDKCIVKHEVFDSTAYSESLNKSEGGEGILNYGIAEIDAVKGTMKRGNMVEVIGPPKGGKTTLTTFFVERALEAGLNVVVWPLEGTPEEWKSLLAALMVRKDTRNNGLSVSKGNVMDRKYRSPEEAAAASAALLALSSSKDRGRLSFIDGACYVENMEDVLTYHYENFNRFDVLVVDSPVNVLSMRRMSKTERISECYMNLKAYVSKKMKKPALCLCTAQIKQDVIDYIRSHPNEELDVTAGGESAETIRTPDEVLGVFSTKHERELNRMKIYSVASRHNGDFPTFYAYCELGCGYFESKPELNM